MRTAWLMVVMGLVVALVGAGVRAEEKAAPKKVTVTGVVETGIMAIGAETTGVIIKTKDQGVYELECKGELAKKAEELNGKSATVTGVLTIKPGVEIKERRIIAVEAMAEKK